MGLIVQKFGGTSIADAHHIFNVAKKVTDLYSENNDIIVVVSAQGDTTDKLIDMASTINPDASKREMDVLLSTGEQISIALLAMAIEKLGIPAISLTGWQAGFLTDSLHCCAKIDSIITDRIKHELEQKKIVIIAGFQGLNSTKDITTMGRGGSDTSAVAIASAMNADVCKIYTDVDGIYTADPRIVPNAKKLNEISYEEIFTLSFLGAQVLNKRSIEMAKNKNVEVEVLSSITNSPGTIVKNTQKSTPISGIAADNNIAKITVTNLENKIKFADEIFSQLKSLHIELDSAFHSVGQTSAKDITFTAPKDRLNEVVTILEKYADEEPDSQIFYDKNKSKISVVNFLESLNINIASMVFETLFEAGINIEMVACDETRVSVLVPSTDIHTALGSIHKKFFEEDNLL